MLSLGRQRGLLFPSLGRFCLELIRVPARGDVRLSSTVAHSFRGDRDSRGDSFAKGANGIPDFLGLVKHRHQLADRLLSRQLIALGLLDPLSGCALGVRGCLLSGKLRVERQLGLGVVVGKQPGSGITQLGLDNSGPARHLSLSAQRLQLTTNLANQIVKSF